MDVQERNGVKIYSLNTGAQLPPWLGERARRNLSKRDANIRHRVELLQDFEMPSSSSKLRQSRDGRFIFAAGVYPPRIKCYDLDQLGMKFERYLDADPVDVQMLGDDFGKLAILTTDRAVAFHAPYGQHSTIRIPSFGRAMSYEPTTCDLLVPASAGQVYRFDLEEGRFKSPWNCQAGGTCIAVSPTHALSAVGCEDGVVRCFDNRASGEKPMVKLDIAALTEGMGFYAPQEITGVAGELTSIDIDSLGLHLVCGTKTGCAPLFDMRSSKPLHIKEHQNGLPIHTVAFHKGSNSVISSDSKLIKIWHTKQSEGGKVLANIESKVDLTHVMIAADVNDPSGTNSGLLLCASEDPRMQAYYCPALGAAPRWCSFLDSITEELEEENLRADNNDGAVPALESVYEDYKFVTRDEVEQLGISNLIGTNLLRGYMHGYFMNVGLYSKVRAVANPFEYDEYRKKKIKEKMEEKQASRISTRKSKRDKALPKINADLAMRMEQKATGLKNSKAVAESAKSVLADDRFSSLFQNPDFEVDENDEDFKLRNASGVARERNNRAEEDMDSDRDDDDEEEEGNQDVASFTDTQEGRVGFSDDNHDTDSGEEGSDEDGFANAKVSVERAKYKGGKGLSNCNRDSDHFPFVKYCYSVSKVRGDFYEGAKGGKKGAREVSRKARKKRITYEAVEEESSPLKFGLGDVEEQVKRSKTTKLMPLEERLKQHEQTNTTVSQNQFVVRTQGSSRSTTYTPVAENKKNKSNRTGNGKDGGRERRSAKGLGRR
jgi:ribosome biogenesis protein ENP2